MGRQDFDDLADGAEGQHEHDETREDGEARSSFVESLQSTAHAAPLFHEKSVGVVCNGPLCGSVNNTCCKPTPATEQYSIIQTRPFVKVLLQ